MSGNHQTNENLPGGNSAEHEDGTELDMSVEARARRQGWHPESEYRGPADRKPRFLTAEQYLKRADDEIHIARANTKKLQEGLARNEVEIRGLKGEIAKRDALLEDTQQAVVDIRGMLTTAEERAYKRAREELSQKMDDAIDAGDAATAKQARKELEEVTEEARKRAATKPVEKKKVEPDPQKPQVDQDAKAWTDAPEQAWYHENEDANAYANGLFIKMGKDPKTARLPTARKLEIVREKAMEKFPEYFEDEEGVGDEEPEREEKPQRRSAVATPRSPGNRPRGNGKSFDDMPEDAKQQWKREAAAVAERAKHKGTKDAFTKEEFAKYYFGDDAAAEE